MILGLAEEPTRAALRKGRTTIEPPKLRPLRRQDRDRHRGRRGYWGRNCPRTGERRRRGNGCGPDRDAVNRVAAEIERAGGQALPAVGSVTSAADAQRVVAITAQRFGGVDLLVNNASVVIYGEVPEFTEEDWDTVVDTT